jgi:uracil-DNA glycosylase
MLASYHVSRQNTNTGRLTEAMFDAVWKRVGALLSEVPGEGGQGGTVR